MLGGNRRSPGLGRTLGPAGSATRIEGEHVTSRLAGFHSCKTRRGSLATSELLPMASLQGESDIHRLLQVLTEGQVSQLPSIQALNL